MENKKIIRAADFIPEQREDDDDNIEAYGLPASEQMLYGIFGDMPSYSNPKHEEIWQEVMDIEHDEMVAYCLEKGIDVMGDDEEPVDGWRDIAVMLKAIERGIIKLVDKPESGGEA